MSSVEEGDIELMLSGIFPLLKDSIDFASVSPIPDLFPIEEFKQSLVEVLDRDRGEAFLYPEINGYGPLRESISGFLKENYSISASKEQILITSGGQQGLDIISKSLVKTGDVILVENPTYPGAYAAFKSRGARIIGIPLEEDGIDIEVLKQNIRRYKPKFIYLMPNYQSPTTISYSRTKKEAVLKLAEEYGFYIIEDDFLTDLSFEDEKKEPLKSLDSRDRVIFVKSFSKIFMPGVRIGFMTLPPLLFKQIIKAKHSTDISSSGYLQRAFDLYLRKGLWVGYMGKIKEVYKEKYLIMAEGLDKLKHVGLEYHRPGGGLSLWVRIPESWDAMELYEECNKRKLAIVPGKVFYTEPLDRDSFIRLSFSAEDPERIRKGLSLLEDILSGNEGDEVDRYMPFL
jgi:DNA-binding transcriptional MocR family regulator